MEHIQAQKDKLSERHKIFTMSKLSEGYFGSVMRINCCRPIDGGRKLVIGTDFGVYVSESRPKDASQKPKRMLETKLVTQLEVLEQHQILIVLADKAVYTFPLEALDPDEGPGAPSKRGKRICHANYINAGMCNGQTLVCCVKSSSLSSTVKVFEPMDSITKGKKKSGLAKMLASGQDVLKPYKEFYIPMESNSIHFLRSKLCVGGAKGFEIVSLETLETQSLLDQADTSLDFVARRENVKPIYIERNTSEFLLCYNDFSFYVNKNGWRARGDWKILWEGSPNAFATWGEKYILAFEPEFIEIRQSDSGGLVCIQTHKNIRFLHQSTREVSRRYCPSWSRLDCEANMSTRFCSPTKTSWARMSSPQWTSGVKGSSSGAWFGTWCGVDCTRTCMMLSRIWNGHFLDVFSSASFWPPPFAIVVFNITRRAQFAVGILHSGHAATAAAVAALSSPNERSRKCTYVINSEFMLASGKFQYSNREARPSVGEPRGQQTDMVGRTTLPAAKPTVVQQYRLGPDKRGIRGGQMRTTDD